MDYIIKKLTPDLQRDYFDFFDNRAFFDDSRNYLCYCNAYNMSKRQIYIELYQQVQTYGGGDDEWKRALRESAVRMVRSGKIQGYLVFDNEVAIGWCNTNDRINYYRVGEFDLSHVPADKIYDNCYKKGKIKSIVCFEISPEYRGKGIATQLLDRVCKDAKLDGYECVEVYPMVNEKNSLAYTGPISLYEKAGFYHYKQRGNTLVMRKALI